MEVNNKNIVLIGFMGTGKTSVGRLISSKMNMNFIDIDEEIKSRISMSIGDIFLKHGEAFFRSIESEVVKEICNKKNCVISTGGGVVLNYSNIENLSCNGVIIQLKGSGSTILRNVTQELSKSEDRPLLQSDNLFKRIVQLMEEREPYYAKCSEYEVCIDNMSQQQVVDYILKTLSLKQMFGFLNLLL